MAISLRQLRQFLVLSEELHFGRAAERLNISQPPLSASLRQLEEELDVRLFDRSSRGTRLTAAGVMFSERTAKILGQLDAAKIALANVAGGIEGSIAIGFLPSMIFRHFTDVITSFCSEYPKLKLVIDELNSTRQLEAIERHLIDVGFIHAMPLPKGIDSHTLERERFVCCLPRGHRLVTRSRISLSELGGERILIFAKRDASHYHDHIAALIRSADLEPHSDFRLQHWFTTLMLIGQGLGVSIVPQSLARSKVASADVVFVELEEEHAYHELQLVWRDSDMRERASPVAEFVSHVKRYYLEFNPSR